MTVKGINGEEYGRGWPLGIAHVVVSLLVLFAGWLGMVAGEANMARLANDAFAREEMKTHLLEISVSQNERTLAYVLARDAMLHSEIQAKYPAHPHLVAWQELDR